MGPHEAAYPGASQTRGFSMVSEVAIDPQGCDYLSLDHSKTEIRARASRGPANLNYSPPTRIRRIPNVVLAFERSSTRSALRLHRLLSAKLIR